MKIKVNYEIDSMDWTSGHDDRQRCVDALSEWFDGLSLKSQLAIHYAQQTAAQVDDPWQFDGWNGDCPWLTMQLDAEARIIDQFAPWTREHCGFNLRLYTINVEREGWRAEKAKQEATA